MNLSTLSRLWKFSGTQWSRYAVWLSWLRCSPVRLAASLDLIRAAP